MKTSLTLFATVAFAIATRSQTLTYLGAGFNSCSHQNSLSAYSNILDNFNNARPWLEQKLASPGIMSDFTFSFGDYQPGHSCGFLIELKYYRTRYQTQASGIDSSGNEMSFALRLRSEDFQVGIGITPINAGRIALGPFFGIGFGRYYAQTKTLAGSGDVNWTNIQTRADDPLLFGATAGLHLHIPVSREFLTFYFRPYYKSYFLLDTIYFDNLDKHLNHPEAEEIESTQLIPATPAAFGCEAGIWISFN